MPLPGREQESVSVVTYDGEVRRFSTTIPKDMRYMVKKGLTPKTSKLDGEEVAWTFDIPENWSYLPRPKKKVSDEQRAKAAERMRKNAASEDESDDEE